ncbi:Transcription factor bye1 [Quaeritorhiza haematococci]|nr:Transcription factor bye1 [Quaeritorhiza haematococci]
MDAAGGTPKSSSSSSGLGGRDRGSAGTKRPLAFGDLFGNKEKKEGEGEEGGEGDSRWSSAFKRLRTESGESGTAAVDEGDEGGEGQQGGDETYSPGPSPPHTPPGSPPPDDGMEGVQSDAAAEPEQVDPDAVVWKGKLHMPQVGKFSGECIQVAGYPVGNARVWEDVLPAAVSIDGRIAIRRVADYLRQQRYSTTKEIVVVEFRPGSCYEDKGETDDAIAKEREGYTTLFEYFRTRERYAVIGHHYVSIKDMYVIPLRPDDPIPDFLVDLPGGCRIPPAPRERDTLYGVIVLVKEVIRGADSRQNQQQPPSTSYGYKPSVGVTEHRSYSSQQHTPSSSSSSSYRSSAMSFPSSSASSFSSSALPTPTSIIPPASHTRTSSSDATSSALGALSGMNNNTAAAATTTYNNQTVAGAGAGASAAQVAAVNQIVQTLLTQPHMAGVLQPAISALITQLTLQHQQQQQQQPQYGASAYGGIGGGAGTGATGTAGGMTPELVRMLMQLQGGGGAGGATSMSQHGL